MMLDYRASVGAFVMFWVLGSAAGAQSSSSQATQQPTGYAPVQAPVCAVLAGDKQSYWNEDEARRAGALILSAGECRNKPSSGY